MVDDKLEKYLCILRQCLVLACDGYQSIWVFNTLFARYDGLTFVIEQNIIGKKPKPNSLRNSLKYEFPTVQDK